MHIINVHTIAHSSVENKNADNSIVVHYLVIDVDAPNHTLHTYLQISVKITFLNIFSCYFLCLLFLCFIRPMSRMIHVQVLYKLNNNRNMNLIILFFVLHNFKCILLLYCYSCTVRFTFRLSIYGHANVGDTVINKYV